MDGQLKLCAIDGLWTVHSVCDCGSMDSPFRVIVGLWTVQSV